MTTRLVGLGDAKILTSTGVITPAAEIVFATGLYLSMERGREVSRESLASLLWPTLNPASRNHRLRQTILKLRALHFPVESKAGRMLFVARPSINVDVEESEAYQTAQATEVGAFFLPGYHPSFSESFSEWLDTTRGRIHGSIARDILLSLNSARLAGDWDTVEAQALQLLKISPLNEEGTLALAEAMAMRGAKSSALAILDEFESAIGATPALRAQSRTMRRRMSVVPSPSRRVLNRPLVGRQSVMRRLTKLVSSAKTSSGTACLLLGSAGIGKSRVLSELLEFGTLEGLTCLQVQCRDGHRHAPLSVFVQLVPELRALRGSLGCSPETIAFLDRLTRYDPRRRTASPPTTDSAWIFFHVRRALFDLLDAVAEEQPVLVAIEDIQWLDNASASLLSDMIAWAKDKRIMFAVTGRQYPQEWPDTHPPGIDVISLSPLSIQDARHLIESLVAGQQMQIDSTYAEWCIGVADGNPYFLTELITYWLETGLEHHVPPSLAELLRQRIGRLSADGLEVLQTISLLENDSTLQRIEQVLEYDAHNLLRSIDELGRAEMISLRSAESGGNIGLISSKHELLSTVAVQQLSPPAKSFLHRRIGQVLDAEISERFLVSTVWTSAKHWQLAGDSNRAWHLAKECGLHLMKVGMFSEAAEAFEKAMAFAQLDEQKLELYEGKISSFYQMSAWGNVREAWGHLNSLRSRLPASSPRHDEFELMLLRAEWQELDWKTTLDKALECLDAADATPAHRAAAGVMAMMLITFTWYNDDLQQVYCKLEPLLEHATVSASTKFLGQMVYHTTAGDLVEAQKSATYLIDEEMKGGDIGGLLRAYGNAAVMYRVAGKFADAERSVRAALQLAEAHGLSTAKIRLLPTLGNLALEIGDIAMAHEAETKLTELNIDATNRFSRLELLSLRTRLALAEDRGAEARKHLPRTLDEAMLDSVPYRRTYTLALQVAVLLAERQCISNQLLEEFSKAFERSKTGVHQAFAACTLAGAYKSIGRADQAARTLKDYQRSRREPWPLPTHMLQWLSRIESAR